MPSLAVFGSSIPALLASLVCSQFGFSVDLIHQGLQQPPKKSLLAYAINPKNMEFLQQFIRLADAQPISGLRLFYADTPCVFPPRNNYMTIVPRDRLFHELCQAVLQNPRIQALDYNPHKLGEMKNQSLTYAQKNYDYAIITDKNIAESAGFVRQQDYSSGGKIGILLASAKLQKPHKTTAVQLMKRDFLALLPLDFDRQANLVWSSLSPEQQQPQTKEQLERTLSSRLAKAGQQIASIEDFTSFSLETYRLNWKYWASSQHILLGDATFRAHPLAGQGLNISLSIVQQIAQGLKRESRLDFLQAVNRSKLQVQMLFTLISGLHSLADNGLSFKPLGLAMMPKASKQAVGFFMENM